MRKVQIGDLFRVTHNLHRLTSIRPEIAYAPSPYHGVRQRADLLKKPVYRWRSTGTMVVLEIGEPFMVVDTYSHRSIAWIACLYKGMLINMPKDMVARECTHD